MTEPDILGVADCHELRDYLGAPAWVWWAATTVAGPLATDGPSVRSQVSVQFLTTDADLIAYVRPVSTDMIAGLEPAVLC